MARYAISGRSTVVGTSARAGVSLYAVANRRAVIREVGVFNTTTTAFVAAIQRFTAATNVGAGLTEAKIGDTDSPDAECTGFAGHTGDSTAGDELARASLGAAIGAGMVWTFDDEGIRIPPGTANGVGITCPVGTGQIFDYYIIWEE